MYSYLRTLDKVLRNLAQSQDMKSLCYQAVSSVLREFEVDRCGVLLFDAKTNEQVGTWGTDQYGQLRDENHLRLPVDNHLIMDPEEGEEGMIVNLDSDLRELGVIVGRGWHIQCGIFDHNDLLGWLFVDNLVHSRELQQEQIDMIRAFAASFGQMLVKFRQNELLKDLNRNLESQNIYLEKALESLATAQERLVEGEKMAALGRLVQGVAHELNTPLGNSQVAISELQHMLQECEQKASKKDLTGDDVRSALSDLNLAADMTVSNIKRAASLVSQFKKMAVSEEFDHLETVDIRSFIDQLIHSIYDLLPDLHKKIKFNIESEADLAPWALYPGAFSQVLTHLISNASKHGLKNRESGEITIRAESAIQNGQPKLKVTFSDDGMGVNDEDLKVLFDPFFTRNRQVGSGLGASIVYNLVNQRMKGSIKAMHNPGGGLKFEFWLPEIDLSSAS